LIPLYAGRPPLLVVGSSGGELVILEAPADMHAKRSDDAAIPPGSLTRGFLRAQYPITAIVTVSPVEAATVASGAVPGTANAPISDDGTFWVFAACADKSIRRYRMLTDAQRAALKSSNAVPKNTFSAAQNYQVIVMGAWDMFHHNHHN